METLILTALGVLIVLLVFVLALLLKRGTASDSGRVDASLRGMQEAKDVMSENALKTVSAISSIGETVYRLAQQQEKAEQLGQSLKDLLQTPKLRGSFGETILEEMLERVLPAGIWERQYMIEGREMVDCVVRFKDVVVPIDAKFPRDDYMRYLEAPTDEEKTRCWKDFERAVKEKITSIESKYVKPERGTSEFALMFIPSEAIYYETIAEKNHLGEPSSVLEFAQKHHVFPVSPNTFYAFLQIIALGIRNVEIIKSAKMLQQGLSALQRSFDLFYKRYEEMGKGIERATEAYRVGGGHIDSYKRRLDGTLQLEGLQDEVSALPGDAVTDE